ncbi:MAG: efflux RND transporter periplasmic adaptor subunit, partial [Nitrospirota bacterium]|nr:efflux RND transporter periplasmic adaptor subunit [Nitrospirota bacterium]
TRAVQTGQKGSFVFVLKDDSTVDARPVTAGRTFGSESVIDSGLKPGEKIITDGQLRLMPGTKVEIKTEKQLAKGEESKEQGAKSTEQSGKDKEKGRAK